MSTTAFVWSPCGIVANMLDYNIVISKYELQSYYYIQFQPLNKESKPNWHPLQRKPLKNFVSRI